MTSYYRERMRQGAGQPNLNTQIVKTTLCPVPPLGDQMEILSRLHSEAERSRTFIQLIAAAITLLREYRSALISAAVTGQLDLRKHEKQLEALA